MTILEVIEMKPYKLSGVIVIAALLCIGVLAAIGNKPTAGGSQGTLIRAKFGNAPNDKIQSDLQFSPCGSDYVDKSDPCTGIVDATGAVIPNAQQASLSEDLTASLYFLRTIPGCCATSTTGWEQYVVQPSRWLVLDFSGIVSGRPCGTTSGDLDIDTEVKAIVDAITNSSKNWAFYHLPTPVPPTPVLGCGDNVDVRFIADQAANPNATSTSLTLVIDRPELQVSRTGGARIYWDALYTLHFQQPLQITNRDATTGALTLTTTGSSSDLADLLDANNNPVGTYHMPVSVILTPAK